MSLFQKAESNIVMSQEKSIFHPSEKDDSDLIDMKYHNHIGQIELNEAFIPDETTQIYFGIDLIQKSQYELDLLRLFDNTPGIYEEENVRRAVYRYEKYWLPLLAQYSSSGDLKFAPPLDIHWVWHVHLLCPHAYSNDCKEVTGRLIGHQLSSLDELEQWRNKARNIWNNMFPNEPFDVVGSSSTRYNSKVEKFDSKISYAIAEASSRQNSFYYQVSLPHYRDSSFQRESLMRYKMFLHLKKKNLKQFLVPCYDIDLLWHTHQLHPQVYRDDTTRILGFILNHDDNVTDRSEGSKLADADSQTRKLWYKTYKVQFARPGCMYRGNPPQGRLCDLDEEFQKNMISTRDMHIAINKIVIPWPRADVHDVHLYISLDTGTGMQKIHEVNCTVTKSGQLSVKNGQGIVHFNVSDKNEAKLRLEIYKQESYSREMIAASEQPINLFDFSNYHFIVISHQIKAGASLLPAELGFSISNERQNPPTKTSFSIQPGTFSDCIIPETSESLWGPVPLKQLPHGVDNNCRAVVHEILGGSGSIPLTAHILHSLPLLMSAVQIYQGDKMALVAHLVGLDQIGYEARLGLSPDVMKNRRNWRAMIMKDSEGDWGMAIACWKGMRKARQGVKGKIKSVARVKGKPGYFAMKFINLRHPERKSEIIKLPVKKDKYKFKINNTEVDLKEGTITVKPEEKDVVQSIALSFVTSILYLMVQPRPKNMEIKKKRSSRQPLWQGNNNVDFFNWCGWQHIDCIPTNFTLHYNLSSGGGSSADGGGCGGCGGGCGAGDAYGTVGGAEACGGDAGGEGCGGDAGGEGCSCGSGDGCACGSGDGCSCGGGCCGGCGGC